MVCFLVFVSFNHDYQTAKGRNWVCNGSSFLLTKLDEQILQTSNCKTFSKLDLLSYAQKPYGMFANVWQDGKNQQPVFK